MIFVTNFIYILHVEKKELNIDSVLDAFKDTGYSDSKLGAFGRALNLRQADIDKFLANHPKDKEQVRLKIVDYWLKNCSEPQWDILADAADKLQERNLAVRLRSESDQLVMHYVHFMATCFYCICFSVALN